jgi:hypothetical protein
MDQVIAKLRENEARPPEQRGLVVLLLDETQHVTNFTEVKNELWGALGDGKIIINPNPPKSQYYSQVAQWQNHLETALADIATQEEIKKQALEASERSRNEADSSFGKSEATERGIQAIKAADAAIQTHKAQLEAWRNSNIMQLLTAIEANFGTKAFKGFGDSTAQAFSRALIANPAETLEKWRQHFLAQPTEELDARPLVLALASNPKKMDGLEAKFKELPPDEQTYDRLHELAKELAPKDKVFEDILEQFRTPGNADVALYRRLQVPHNSVIYPYSSVEYKEMTRRNLQRGYDREVASLLTRMKLPASEVPKLMISDQTIDRIFSKIKADPLAGVASYVSALRASQARMFEKLRNQLLSQLETTYKASGGRQHGLPPEIELTIEGATRQFSYKFTSPTSATTSKTWLTAPASLVDETKPIELQARPNSAELAELRQAYTMAGHIVSGLANFKTLPMGLNIPLEMQPGTVSSGGAGSLWELPPGSSYGQTAAFAKMLLG